MPIVCLAILFSILVATSPVAAASTLDAASQEALSWREETIPNPVFGGDTFIFEAGQKQQQTIILVHGIGDEASSIWRSLAVDLAPAYHVIGFDLPGFGRSGKENTLYSPQRYIEFIDWMITTYASGKIILVGHSLGGALALDYAAHYPKKVSHLVLVDAAGILHRIALVKNFLHLNSPDDDQDLFSGILSAALKRPLTALNHVTGSLVENLETENSGPVLRAINTHDISRNIVLGGNATATAGLALVQENFTEIIEKATMPTSLIWGRQDEIAPLRTGKLLAGKLFNARLRIIEKAGHVPVLEDPSRFLAVLREELDAPPVKNSVKGITTDAPKSGICKGQNNVVFSGDFTTLNISDCQGVLLKQVHANHIAINNSQVEIEDSSVRSHASALILRHSKISGTNLLLEGDVAIQSSTSRLDLAGAELRGKTAAIQTEDKTLVLFSVSKVSSPHTNANLHGVFRISPDHPL